MSPSKYEPERIDSGCCGSWPGLAVSHQKLIKLLFSAQTIIIFAASAAVKDG